MAVAAACGPRSEADDPGPCDADGVPSDEVAVRVASPLPSVLEAGCVGDPAELGALFLYADTHCALEVEGGEAAGCCPGLRAETYNASILFRRESDRVPIVEQIDPQLELGAFAGEVVVLSFEDASLSTGYNSDGDAASNLVEWCAGTL